MLFEVEYGFGEIPPGASNLKFQFTLRPQPALLREVHAHGAPSTSFDIAIYDREDLDPLHMVYGRTGISLEAHDALLPPVALMNDEKRYVYFLVSNKDSINPCRLRVRLVYEASE